jgi:osmotically-inducible protein OsmY
VSQGGQPGTGSKGSTRSDELIRDDVCRRLSWNDELDATDIAVRVESGEVLLEGSTPTRHMKRLAHELADDVPGVLEVFNTVRARQPVLTELRELISGRNRHEHYANTGTKPPTTLGGI